MVMVELIQDLIKELERQKSLIFSSIEAEMMSLSHLSCLLLTNSTF